MNHSNGFERNQGPWKYFEQMLGMRLPNFKPGQFEKIMQDPSWVEKYVQDVLKKAIPVSDVFSSAQQQPDEKVFETHRSVIARIPVPKEIDPNDLRVYMGIGANQLRLEGLPNNKSTTIPLPANVSVRGSRAKFKDGVLEIRMPKDETKTSETQIEIHYD